MKKAISIIIFCTFFVLTLNIFPKTQNKFRPSAKHFENADKLLSKMTVDEKIGQLIHIGTNPKYMSQDSYEFKQLKRQVTTNKIGGLIFYASRIYDTVHFLNRMQENAEIPLLISADFETGVGMRMFNTTNLPWNMAVSATGNPDFARRMGKVVAKETRAIGTHQIYAPVVDVNNNAKNPVINVRSFGENQKDVARFGIAFSQGLQSGNVIATAKHFPGHGDTAVDSHRGLPVINYSRERLEKTEFLPFREIIKSGVGSVMISHISMPKLDNEIVKPIANSLKADNTESQVITKNTTIPATLSKKIVTNILKKDMNFDGLIVTDAMDMSGLTLYFNQEEAAIRAILAGNDILLKPADVKATIRGIKDAVKSGRISKQRLDESVRKQLAWKYKLGIFKQKITPIEEIDKLVSTQETKKLSAEIANEAITLVKHQNKVLPLKQNQKVLVLCVTNGDDINRIGNEFTNALSSNGLEVVRIGLDKRSSEKNFLRAINEARKSDVVITALFGRVRSGAANSVGIPKSSEAALRKILSLDKPSVSIAFGNPYLILGFPEMKNYVVSYGDMESLQVATANALVQKIEFKGKLPITIGKYKIGTGLSLN